MTTVGPHTGVCLVCGRVVPVVNYSRERWGEAGYLARHWRPGIARGHKCRGSFEGWEGRQTSTSSSP